MSHPLADALRSPDPAVRAAACRSAPDDPSAILLADAIGDVLADPVRAVARAAGDALVVLAGRDVAVVDLLRRALRSEDPLRRIGAAFALARLTPPGPPLLRTLVEALGHRDGDVRWTAARLLVEVGRLHPEVLALLLELTRTDERPRVRRMAAFALRELAPDHPETARALVDASQDDEVHVRRAALTAMAALVTPPAFVATRLVRVLMGDPDAASRRIATVALGALGAADLDSLPPEATQALRELAGSAPDPDLRRGAIRALTRLGLATTADDRTRPATPAKRPSARGTSR